VDDEELAILLDKLRYLSRGADFVVFSGSLPRGVDDGFYAEAIRDLNRRGVPCVLDAEGPPLRLGTEAEPFLVSPNQREAESLAGQEFRDDEDFRMALDTIAEIGARNVLISQESGCFCRFREERNVRYFAAGPPRVEPVSSVGAGDVLLAAFLAGRVNGKTLEESLRSAVATAAASTLEVGAGVFDSASAGRLHAASTVTELESVVSTR
jgi:fructose-1-phosphate kinase PfkB-like protein